MKKRAVATSRTARRGATLQKAPRSTRRAPPGGSRINTTDRRLSDAEVALLHVIHDLWIRRDEWPKRRMLDTDPRGPVPPTRVAGVLDSLRERRLIEHEGSSDRVALRLAALAGFRSSARLVRMIGAFLDWAREDVIVRRDRSAGYRTRELCASLHVGIRDVRRLAMALAPDRLGAVWFDAWNPNLGENYSDAEMLDQFLLNPPSSYQELVEAKTGAEFMARVAGVGSIPMIWGAERYPSIQEIVLEIAGDGAVFLDGVRAMVPDGDHVATLRVLFAKDGGLLEYGAEDMPSRASSREAVRRRIMVIRRALDTAGGLAGLRGFRAQDFIRAERALGYSMRCEHGPWCIIGPDWL